MSLSPGGFCFQLDGKQTFLLGRNPTGWRVEQFAPLLRWASESGEKLARIHLTHGIAPEARPGEVDDAWAAAWGRVLDVAAARGIHVLPVFGVWGDWSSDETKHGWSQWAKNPFNAANGGPARSPAALLADTPCRKLWLQWLRKLVQRWEKRPNILAWEVFSELDLVTGSSEAAAVAFVEAAAEVVRAADSRRRPVTASLAGINEWPTLFASDAVDIVQVHPYADDPRFRGRLDDMIVETVRQRRKRYGKPVLIGECGLDSRPPRGTLTVAPRAHVGIAHAIWASAVSGAACGRMLWWEDGYDQYGGLDLRTPHRHAAAPVARFVEGVDFAGLRPVATTGSPGVKGAALGHERLVLGWLRDARCVPPDWPVRRLEGESVTLTVPGAEALWRVELVATRSGHVLRALTVRRDGGRVTVPLTPFEDSIAFRMSAQPAELP